MMYNSDITKQKREKRKEEKMIEREQWNEYCYTNNHIYYCRDCWEYNNIEKLDMKNKQKSSYEIEEIINDFLNN